MRNAGVCSKWGPHNNDEIGEPGVPNFMGLQNFMTSVLRYGNMNIASSLHTKARHKLKAESGTVQLNTIYISLAD